MRAPNSENWLTWWPEKITLKKFYPGRLQQRSDRRRQRRVGGILGIGHAAARKNYTTKIFPLWPPPSPSRTRCYSRFPCLSHWFFFSWSLLVIWAFPIREWDNTDKWSSVTVTGGGGMVKNKKKMQMSCEPGDGKSFEREREKLTDWQYHSRQPF